MATQAGPAFVANTDVQWAMFTAARAYERAVHGWETSTLVDEELHREGFAVVDPFQLEATAEKFDVIAVIDVGEVHLIPVAIRAHRAEGGLVWTYDYVDPTPRQAAWGIA